MKTPTPLTDEQIDGLDYLVEATGYCSDNLGVEGTKDFARAIEAARDAQWVEMLAGQEPVATLWQHDETGRTRVIMPGDITDCDARWRKAADLYTHPKPDDTALLRQALKALLRVEPNGAYEVVDEAIAALEARLAA